MSATWEVDMQRRCYNACAGDTPVVNLTLREDYDSIVERCQRHIETFFPPRSLAHVETPFSRPDRQHIDALKSIPQAAQGTAEWFAARDGYVTASSAHKVFGSPSKYIDLLREKVCGTNCGTHNAKYVREDTPIDWGKKYEPASVMYYQSKYNTKLHDYGCIPHKTYPFLAASPDGINDDESSPLYGRMVEVKNIVNRNITGIPKEEYWIQMQMQMEVCDIDCCDFLESRYVEHEPEEFARAYSQTPSNLAFGSIAVFFRMGELMYVYSPLGMAVDEQMRWCEEQCVSQELQWYKNIHYELTEVSCVTVTRNHQWFEASLTKLRSFWEDVQSVRAMISPAKEIDDRKLSIKKTRAKPDRCFQPT